MKKLTSDKIDSIFKFMFVFFIGIACGYLWCYQAFGLGG